jgi:hypothetical protein
MAVERGNYEPVRAYIKDNARRLDQLQLAEHPVLAAPIKYDGQIN